MGSLPLLRVLRACIYGSTQTALLTIMHKPPSDHTKYFLYARKSSESEDRQVQSIEDQISHLSTLARQEGLEIIHVYKESKTAKEPYVRPLFMEMVQRIQNGEAAGIICWKIDRLSRNPVDDGTVKWLLQTEKLKRIRSIEKEYLPKDNVLILSVEQGVANQFIIDLRKNVKRGMEGKADRGWFPSKAPLGYLNDKAENTIVIDPDRFSMVRKMWDVMLSGCHTPHQIVRIANEEWGFTTPKKKREGGGPISVPTIYKLFTNPFYAGTFNWGGKERPGIHTPMITFDEFDKVQMLLNKRGKPRIKRYEFAFTGLIRCAECGSMVTAEEKSRFSSESGLLRKYTYYRCTRKNKAIKCKSQKPVTVDDLEEQIFREILQISVHPVIEQWALQALSEENSYEMRKRKAIVENKKRAIQTLQSEIDSLVRMSYRGLIDDSTFVRERDSLNTQLVRLKSSVENNDSEISYWKNETKKAFLYAATAQAKFTRKSLQAQKQCLIDLGSNFRLKDKKLLFDKHEWLLTIKKAESLIMDEITWLENYDPLITQGLKSPYYAMSKPLRAVIELIGKQLRKHKAKIENSHPKVIREGLYKSSL